MVKLTLAVLAGSAGLVAADSVRAEDACDATERRVVDVHPNRLSTPEQQKKGYTGRDVGVHGPHRHLRWLGPPTNTVSSTAGCVGLGTTDDIERISAWVKSMKEDTIEIR
jgi:hypothetical protein